MIWSYRPTKVKTKYGTYWEVRELYHDKDGDEWGFTRDAITPTGDTKKGLIDKLEMMLDDCKNAKTLKIDETSNDKD